MISHWRSKFQGEREKREKKMLRLNYKDDNKLEYIESDDGIAKKNRRKKYLIR